VCKPANKMRVIVLADPKYKSVQIMKFAVFQMINAVKKILLIFI